MPRRVKSLAPHIKSLPTLSLSLEWRFLPIQTSLVLSIFTFRPDILPNTSRTLRAANKVLLLPSKIKVVSSANCVILNSLPFTEIPFKFLSFTIERNIISQIARLCRATAGPLAA